MITDEARALYKYFELKIVYYPVWKMSTIIYYSEQKCLKGTLPQTHQDDEDDPHQMGGNFIFKFNENTGFERVFDYPSKTPPDRPKPDDLLKFLKEDH